MRSQRSRLLFLATTVLWLSACGKTLSPTSLENGDGDGSTPLVVDGCDLHGKPFGAGDGSPGSPFEICSATHLKSLALAQSKVAYYRLAGDIVVPLGEDLGSNQDFQGDLDGKGHYIAGLVGLPLIQINNGTIHDLEMRDVVLTGSYRVGAIAGENGAAGTILNCHANGKIHSAFASGGLVGFNSGDVKNSSANTTITGTNMLGGLAGVNRGTIERSFSEGSVVGTDMIVGGLVGEQDGGTVNDSYSHASATGKAKVAGLVADNGGTVARSYCDGAVIVTGADPTKAGGLVATGAGGVIVSFWNTTTSGQASSDGGTGESTVALTNPSTFAGWDFTTVWQLSASGGPPLLR